MKSFVTPWAFSLRDEMAADDLRRAGRIPRGGPGDHLAPTLAITLQRHSDPSAGRRRGCSSACRSSGAGGLGEAILAAEHHAPDRQHGQAIGACLDELAAGVLDLVVAAGAAQRLRVRRQPAQPRKQPLGPRSARYVYGEARSKWVAGRMLVRAPVRRRVASVVRWL